MSTDSFVDASAGLRARKKRQTRQAIHRAALELALENGSAHVTSEAIAERAGISPRTFFNYFSTKEDALAGAHPEGPDLLRRDVLSRPAEEPLEDALRAALVHRMMLISEDQPLWRLRKALAQQEPELSARLLGSGTVWERCVVEAAAERAGTNPADDIEPVVIALASLSAFKAAMWQHAMAGYQGDPVARLEDAFAVLDRSRLSPRPAAVSHGA